MDVKLVVFDIAGTTLEDKDAVVTSFCNAFAKYGYQIEKEKVLPLMGYKKPVAIQMILEQAGIPFTDALIADIHNAFESGMVMYYQTSPDVKPLPGVEDVLQQIKMQGIKIALDTGFSKIITDEILARLQWKEKGLVDDYIASDEVPAGRPAPYMIQALMQKLGIEDSSKVVKAGDTEVDVNEGRNARCGLVVAVTTGAFTREQLIPYQPDHIIDNLKELLPLLAL